jgi:pyruvate/2-oxoacid:ferredoxin oxidoreductase beta subunit
MNRKGDFSRQFGLGAIAEELGVAFTAHCAVDDAYATMKVAEAMCKEEGVTFAQLLEKYQITLGRIDNYEITQMSSVALVEYKAAQERKKEEREQKKAEFYRFFDREKRKRKKDGKLKGQTVCFSHPLELELELSKKLLSAVFAEAGYFTSRAEECNLYICFEGEGGARIKSAQERNAKVMTATEFAEYLGV